MKSNWRGLVKVLEFTHLDVDGSIISQKKNLYNLIHSDGDEYMLRALFDGGPTNTYIPQFYYFGLDNRNTPDEGDNMLTILSFGGEPTTNGYVRALAGSSSSFSFTVESDINYAVSPIISFTATSGSWGPVKNLFLTTEIDYDGYLISSTPLGSSTTVEAGQIINMRLSLSLRDCS